MTATLVDDAALGSALAMLWQRHRQTNLDRISLLEATTANVLRSKANDGAVSEAGGAAHKLAGSLGTFGFDAGSRAALEVEYLLREPEINGRPLAEAVTELRTSVQEESNHPVAAFGQVAPEDTMSNAVAAVQIISADSILVSRLAVAAAAIGLSTLSNATVPSLDAVSAGIAVIVIDDGPFSPWIHSDLVDSVAALAVKASIKKSVRALLTLTYPQLEIVMVDDGSTDETLSVLTSTFALVPMDPIYDRRIATKPVRAIYRSHQYPNLVVVSKDNGGKADSLNVGLNISSSELAIDADTILDPDGLGRLVRPFIRSHDVVAAGATIRVANGCTVTQGRLASERGPHRALAGIQAVEYLRALLFGRPGWNRLGGNLLISGAFGLFRRENLLETNGYVKSVGEDMELIVRLRRHGYETGQPARIEFVPDPVAWTETPTGFRELGRQRERWQRGFTDVLWRHRSLLLNPRFGVLGMVVFPAFVLFEWMAPVIEVVGLILVALGLILGQLSAVFAIPFFSLACGLGILLSMLALMLRSSRSVGTVGLATGPCSSCGRCSRTSGTGSSRWCGVCEVSSATCVARVMGKDESEGLQPGRRSRRLDRRIPGSNHPGREGVRRRCRLRLPTPPGVARRSVPPLRSEGTASDPGGRRRRRSWLKGPWSPDWCPFRPPTQEEDRALAGTVLKRRLESADVKKRHL